MTTVKVKESVFGTSRDTTFFRDGLRVAGRLYTPHGLDTARSAWCSSG